MDALEDQGIIGPPTGTSKARAVYGVDGQAIAPSAEENGGDAADSAGGVAAAE